MRLAHVENEQIVALVQARLQVARRDFRYPCRHYWSLLAPNSAELLVIDQLIDGAMFAANWAVRILAQPVFLEGHGQRIEPQQTAGKRLADAENELDRLH